MVGFLPERAADRDAEEDTVTTLSKVRLLSKHAFAALGYAELAYVKRVEADGFIAYVAHAADGSYLCQFTDREAACATLREHDLEPVSLH